MMMTDLKDDDDYDGDNNEDTDGDYDDNFNEDDLNYGNNHSNHSTTTM